MFTAQWLFWYLGVVKAWLAGVVSTQIATVVATQPPKQGEAGSTTVAVAERAAAVEWQTVSAGLYMYVRVAAYMAWLGELLFMQHEAKEHEVPFHHVPSMEGISPAFVDDAVREELRIVDGRVEAPLEDVTERLAVRLVTVAPAIARRTGMHLLDDEMTVQEGTLAHSIEHGTPLGRLIQTAYSDEPEMPQIREVFDSEPEIKALLDVTLEDYVSVYSGKDLDKITPDMLEDIGILKSGLTKAERRVMVDAWKSAALAEIEVLGHFETRPNMDYYNWFMNPKTGEVEYVTPPRNAVFKWLRGKLSDPALELSTESDYRAKAIEIIESLDDDWWEKDLMRWARIPTGDYTCPFCIVLASRGAVYHESYTAQGFDHENCDCLIVPVYDPDNYPFKEVTDAAKKAYFENKDLFKPKQSKTAFWVTDSKGNSKRRHKTYFDAPPDKLAAATEGFPRVDNSEYKKLVAQQDARLKERINAELDEREARHRSDPRYKAAFDWWDNADAKQRAAYREWWGSLSSAEQNKYLGTIPAHLRG